MLTVAMFGVAVYLNNDVIAWLALATTPIDLLLFAIIAKSKIR